MFWDTPGCYSSVEIGLSVWRQSDAYCLAWRSDALYEIVSLKLFRAAANTWFALLFLFDLRHKIKSIRRTSSPYLTTHFRVRCFLTTRWPVSAAYFSVAHLRRSHNKIAESLAKLNLPTTNLIKSGTNKNNSKPIAVEHSNWYAMIFV